MIFWIYWYDVHSPRIVLLDYVLLVLVHIYFNKLAYCIVCYYGNCISAKHVGNAINIDV